MRLLSPKLVFVFALVCSLARTEETLGGNAVHSGSGQESEKSGSASPPEGSRPEAKEKTPQEELQEIVKNLQLPEDSEAFRQALLDLKFKTIMEGLKEPNSTTSATAGSNDKDPIREAQTELLRIADGDSAKLLTLRTTLLNPKVSGLFGLKNEQDAKNLLSALDGATRKQFWDEYQNVKTKGELPALMEKYGSFMKEENRYAFFEQNVPLSVIAKLKSQVTDPQTQNWQEKASFLPSADRMYATVRRLAQDPETKKQLGAESPATYFEQKLISEGIIVDAEQMKAQIAIIRNESARYDAVLAAVEKGRTVFNHFLNAATDPEKGGIDGMMAKKQELIEHAKNALSYPIDEPQAEEQKNTSTKFLKNYGINTADEYQKLLDQLKDQTTRVNSAYEGKTVAQLQAEANAGNDETIRSFILERAVQEPDAQTLGFTNTTSGKLAAMQFKERARALTNPDDQALMTVSRILSTQEGLANIGNADYIKNRVEEILGKPMSEAQIAAVTKTVSQRAQSGLKFNQYLQKFVAGHLTEKEKQDFRDKYANELAWEWGNSMIGAKMNIAGREVDLGQTFLTLARNGDGPEIALVNREALGGTTTRMVSIGDNLTRNGVEAALRQIEVGPNGIPASLPNVSAETTLELTDAGLVNPWKSFNLGGVSGWGDIQFKSKTSSASGVQTVQSGGQEYTFQGYQDKNGQSFARYHDKYGNSKFFRVSKNDAGTYSISAHGTAKTLLEPNHNYRENAMKLLAAWGEQVGFREVTQDNIQQAIIDSSDPRKMSYNATDLINAVTRMSDAEIQIAMSSKCIGCDLKPITEKFKQSQLLAVQSQTNRSPSSGRPVDANGLISELRNSPWAFGNPTQEIESIILTLNPESIQRLHEWGASRNWACVGCALGKELDTWRKYINGNTFNPNPSN